MKGPLLAEVNVPKGETWSVVKATISKLKPGIHHVVVLMKGEGKVDVDWINFE